MENLLEILSKCTTDPQFLSKANEILKDFENYEGYGPALLQLINSNASNATKTLAAILLKNQISSSWSNFSATDQQRTKQSLLTTLMAHDPKIQNLLVSFI